MKVNSFEILMPAVTEEKLANFEDAVHLAGSIFKRNRDDFKVLYSADEAQNGIKIQGESLQINHQELEEQIIKNLEKKSSRLLLFPFQQTLKRYAKPTLSHEHNIIFESSFPVLTYKNNIKLESIRNVIAPIELNEDFMPLVLKVLKFVKGLKSATLHIVSVLHNSDDYKLNKTTQQLSLLNHLFAENNVKYTAEIINSQNDAEIKSDIVLDHINRVNADLVVLYKNQLKFGDTKNANINLLEIISKSEVPIITFI